MKLEENKFLYHETWSLTWTVEVIKTSFPFPWFTGFSEKSFFNKNNLKYGRIMNSNAIALNLTVPLLKTVSLIVPYGFYFLEGLDI